MGEGRKSCLTYSVHILKASDLWECRHLEDDFSPPQGRSQTSGLTSVTTFVQEREHPPTAKRWGCPSSPLQCRRCLLHHQVPPEAVGTVAPEVPGHSSGFTEPFTLF